MNLKHNMGPFSSADPTAGIETPSEVSSQFTQFPH